MQVGPETIGSAAWRRSSTFRYRGTRRVQHEVVVVAHLQVPRPELDTSHQLLHETEAYLGWRWAQVGDVVASGDGFYPGKLPQLLPVLLVGETIDEPVGHWS